MLISRGCRQQSAPPPGWKPVSVSVVAAAAGTLGHGRAGIAEALHLLQGALLALPAGAWVAHVGAVVLIVGTFRVGQALL